VNKKPGKERREKNQIAQKIPGRSIFATKHGDLNIASGACVILGASVVNSFIVGFQDCTIQRGERVVESAKLNQAFNVLLIVYISSSLIVDRSGISRVPQTWSSSAIFGFLLSPNSDLAVI
jgi:hypothetical protein